MINGILFYEDGTLQQIGNINTLGAIIGTLEKALPELKKRERARLVNELSKEELEIILEEKRLSTLAVNSKEDKQE